MSIVRHRPEFVVVLRNDHELTFVSNNRVLFPTSNRTTRRGQSVITAWITCHILRHRRIIDTPCVGQASDRSVIKGTDCISWDGQSQISGTTVSNNTGIAADVHQKPISWDWIRGEHRWQQTEAKGSQTVAVNQCKGSRIHADGLSVASCCQLIDRSRDIVGDIRCGREDE